jgi:hypothetical protein
VIGEKLKRHEQLTQKEKKVKKEYHKEGDRKDIYASFFKI